ncbi:MAG: hypothetical protein COA58_07930 [Bacteroidetes bacterium]|nr:MAG: hypothetical protein COA58_07930 [Bacteroidota bacterium]
MGLFVSSIKVALIGFVVCTPILLSASKMHISGQESDLLRSIHKIEQIIGDNSQRSNGLKSEIANLEYEMYAARKIVRLADKNENVSQNELMLLQQQLNVLNEEKQRAINQYQSILIEEYKNRDYKTKLYFLASSKTLGEFVNRLNHLSTLKDLRKKQLIVLSNKQKEVTDKLEVYSSSKEEKKKISAKKVMQMTKLNSLLRIRHQKYRELKSDKNELQLELNTANLKLSELNNAIRERIIEPSTKSGTGNFVLKWPVKYGLVVGQFGVEKHAKERKVLMENNGIDILVSKSEKVISSASGTVKAVLQIPGLNTSIIVDHNGYFSVYSNIKDVKLQKGDRVEKGDLLGPIAMDENGLCKLHFEVWKGTTKVDPELFLEGSLN